MGIRGIRNCFVLLAAAAVFLVTTYIKTVATVPSRLDTTDVRARGPMPADDPRVVALVRKGFLNPPSTLPYNLSGNPNYQKGEITWEFIHNHTERLFSGLRGGFFVEAGALDGEKGSNTLWLEQELNWTGLLVEPDSKSYSKLFNKHRKAWSSNTCLSPKPYPTETVLVTLARRRLSDNKYLESRNTHRGLTHLLGTDLETHQFDYFIKNSDESYTKKQCFPLVSYLLALNISTVDFLSLDIQGAEKNVLENIPWDKLVIRVIVIEVSNHDVFERDFRGFMEEKKYVLIAEGFIDYIYVRQNDSLLKNL